MSDGSARFHDEVEKLASFLLKAVFKGVSRVVVRGEVHHANTKFPNPACPLRLARGERAADFRLLLKI